MTDILAFGPHPDDVEIGLGGTLALHAGRGDNVVIIDLTRGELGSNGTPDERVQEAADAARILGVRERLNLGLPDGGLGGPGHWGPDGDHLRRCVAAIRQHRPRIVAVPYGVDRHPDHVAAHRLLVEAVHRAALHKYDTGQPALTGARTVFYFINDAAEPSFLVDITPVWRQKSESLLAHRSQFRPGTDGVPTRLTAAHGLGYLVDSRDRYFGGRLGVEYAEGFWLASPPMRPGLLD